MLVMQLYGQNPIAAEGSSSETPVLAKKKALGNTKSPIKNQSPESKLSGVSGAATRIRTGDLILTKDVLYQLSHSSVSKDVSS